MNGIPASRRASSIEYAIRDVVVPAMELERGHDLIKLNIGDPLSYPASPRQPHGGRLQTGAGEAGQRIRPSYGIEDLREAIAKDEQSKGWDCRSDDVYVTHGVTEALQVLFAAFLEQGDTILAPGPHYPPTWHILRCTVPRPSNTHSTRIRAGP